MKRFSREQQRCTKEGGQAKKRLKRRESEVKEQRFQQREATFEGGETISEKTLSRKRLSREKEEKKTRLLATKK